MWLSRKLMPLLLLVRDLALILLFILILILIIVKWGLGVVAMAAGIARRRGAQPLPWLLQARELQMQPPQGPIELV
jgi:hypothetical protein